MFNKRIIFLITLVLIVGLTVTTLGADFREVNWGMSREEVKEIEGLKPLSEKPEKLIYDKGVTMFGEDFLLSYFFIEDKLVRSVYVLDTGNNNFPSKTIFNLATNMPYELMQKYGKPDIANRNWKSGSYSPTSENFKRLVRLGYVKFLYGWEKEDINVYFRLEELNGMVIEKIRYYSTDPELVQLRKRKLEKEQENTQSNL